MKLLLVAAAVSSLLSACSLFSASESAKAPLPARVDRGLSQPIAKSAELPSAAQTPSIRRVGDVVVHRFSGEYRKSAVLFSETVVAKEGEYWVVDVALDDGSSTSKLRVRMDDQSRPRSAARLEGDREIEVPIDEYRAMVEKTVFAADRNEGLVSSERSTCLVGSAELDCETKNYKVWVAGQPGSLRISESAELPGRDVSGEITSADGRVLYRAELVELDRGKIDVSIATRE